MMRDVTVELGKFGQAPGQAFCQSALERILAQLCAQLRFSYDDVLQIDEEGDTRDVEANKRIDLNRCSAGGNFIKNSCTYQSFSPAG